MNRARPLALNDDQLSLVLEGARCLSGIQRSKYLDHIADLLLPLEIINREHVKLAVRLAQQRCGGGAG
jgi:hypothetical protein